MFEVLLDGLLLGGMYGLVALGLNLQYGVVPHPESRLRRVPDRRRLHRLLHGDGRWQLNPLLSLLASVPIAFALNWLIYRYLMLPLVRRAPDQDALDADVVLVTFGLFFVLQGLAMVNWSGDLRGYSFLAQGVDVLGARLALNRLLAFLGACGLALALFLILRHTRIGAALRAMTIDPVAAELMGVDVRKFSALAFAAGGALAAMSGMLVSTFISFSATTGVRLHAEGADRGHHGRRRPRDGLAGGRPAAGRGGVAGRLPDRSRPDARHQLRPVPAHPAGAADGAVHPCLSGRARTRGPAARWRSACSRWRCCRAWSPTT